MKFQLIKGSAGSYQWKLLTNSGDIMCESVLHPDKAEAMESIFNLKAWVKDAPVCEVDLSKPSDWQSEAIKLLRAKRNNTAD